MAFCTKADILQVFRAISPDVTDNNLDDSVFTEVIAEADEMVKTILVPRYKLSVINADVPFLVNRLCAIKSALLIATRYLFLTIENDSLMALVRQKKWIKRVIGNGLLFNGSDAEVATEFKPSAITNSNTQFTEVYADGNHPV